MSIRVWLSLLLLLCTSIAWADGPKPTYEIDLTGDIRIGPDGVVRDYRLQTELPPVVAKAVDNNVHTWKFKPILIDGKPVIAKTTMRLSLHAEPAQGDTYTLKVVAVSFGDPKPSRGTMTAPQYPRDAVYARLGAKVSLALKIDARGNVTDVWPEQVSLDKRAPEAVAARWRRLFEKASVGAAKNWKYDPTEVIDDQPVGTIVRTSILFRVSEDEPRQDSTDGRWLAFVPGPMNPNPWETSKPPPTQAELDAMKDGEVQSLASRFQLLDDIVGRTL